MTNQEIYNPTAEEIEAAANIFRQQKRLNGEGERANRKRKFTGQKIVKAAKSALENKLKQQRESS